MSKSVFFTKKIKQFENGVQNIMVKNSVVVHSYIRYSVTNLFEVVLWPNSGACDFIVMERRK